MFTGEPFSYEGNHLTMTDALGRLLYTRYVYAFDEGPCFVWNPVAVRQVREIAETEAEDRHAVVFHQPEADRPYVVRVMVHERPHHGQLVAGGCA